MSTAAERLRASATVTKSKSQAKPRAKKPPRRNPTPQRNLTPEDEAGGDERLTIEAHPLSSLPPSLSLPPSPPMPKSSPPPESPLYNMLLTHLLRVNGRKVLKDSDSCTRAVFTMDWIEDRVNLMLESPALTIDGRQHQVVSQAISFKHSLRASGGL